MKTSYRPEDVTVLLKDITGCIAPAPAQEREKRIQSGTHYSEMLPVEYKPTDTYMQTYNVAVERFANKTAEAVGKLAKKIFRPGLVLVSLARAGTSPGVLLKRYMARYYGVEVPHYTISIIRGRGIDRNALDYILRRHPGGHLQFVDGWTGKGAIRRELEKALAAYPALSPELAVLSDPARITRLCGTKTDFLIPSACMNATVSGLMSRTVLRGDLITGTDFHGAVYYRELEPEDLTYRFISAVEDCFVPPQQLPPQQPEEAMMDDAGLAETVEIARAFGVRDINFVKPSIGETTRVLLRRLPWKILVHDKTDNLYLQHLLVLAQDKGVEVVEYPLRSFKACGIIKDLADT